MDNVARGEKARRIAHGYVGWAVGAGLIPFPLVDVGSLVALQVKMLTEIAGVYGMPLERERARTLVMSTVGGLAPQGVALAGIPVLLKFVPVFGTLLGIAVMPAAAAASTLALADIFIRHIETHGDVPERACPQLAHTPVVTPDVPGAVEVIVDEPAVPRPAASDQPASEATASPPMTEAVVDEPAASDVPSEPAFVAASPPATAEVTVDEPAVPKPATIEQTAIEEPVATAPAVAAASDGDREDGPAASVTADEVGSASGPEEPGNDVVRPDAASDTDADQPGRRRPAAARARRRSPPTETS
ncbi:MAG TPA: DUF697 domain-containing protein [Rhodopila sp.]